MKLSSAKTKSITTAGVLTLAGLIGFLGLLARGEVFQDRFASETEEVSKQVEDGELDDVHAITDSQITLIHGHAFDEWLHTSFDDVSLSHLHRFSPRGPPADSCTLLTFQGSHIRAC